MEATLQNDDGSLFWETPNPFVTEKGAIGIFLDGPASGPSEKQVALWHWMFENAERLEKAAQPLLLERLRDFNLETCLNDLVWSAAGLSTDGDRDQNWDMSFTISTAGRAEGTILTAYFTDGVPHTVCLDT